MEKATQQILAQLYALQDLDYRAFHLRLIPTVSPQRVLGSEYLLCGRWLVSWQAARKRMCFCLVCRIAIMRRTTFMCCCWNESGTFLLR